MSSSLKWNVDLGIDAFETFMMKYGERVLGYPPLRLGQEQVFVFWRQGYRTESSPNGRRRALYPCATVVPTLQELTSIHHQLVLGAKYAVYRVPRIKIFPYVAIPIL